MDMLDRQFKSPECGEGQLACPALEPGEGGNPQERT